MLRFTLLLLLFSIITGVAKAQTSTIKGSLVDDVDRSPIAGATVLLLFQKDSVTAGNTVSDAKGGFEFNNLPNDSFVLVTSYVGYEKNNTAVVTEGDVKIIGVISLIKQGKDLSDVTVVAKVAPTQQKGDTIQYNASQYKVNPDATAEDLIKKMPGVTVDKAGTVTAQGDQVKKVTVDGRDFFGDDATAALKNLPAEVIDKIQVFDKLSEQAAFTGFDDGSSVRAINIVTKSNMRNGQFGRIYAGYGTDGRYAAGGNANFLKDNRRIAVVGLFNNVNQQNFSSQDLLGVTSTSGGGGRGGGRGGGGQGGGGNNFLVGQQNGISKTNSFGINYSNLFGKKLQVTGSYFFNNANNDNNQLSNTQYLFKNRPSQFSDENTISSSKNFNHRINLKLDYKIDSANSLTIIPSVNFQNNKSYNDNSSLSYYAVNDLVNQSHTNTTKNTSGYNITNSILFRHAFAKKRRTISLGVNMGLSNKTGEVYQQSNNTYYKFDSITLEHYTIDDSLQQFNDQVTDGRQLSANIAYTEPVGKKGQLQFNYTPSISKNKANQEVNQYDYSDNKYSKFDSSLSNKFDNTVTTHNAGLTYRVGDKDNMFAAGVAYQYTELNSDQVFPLTTTVNKSFNNVLPNLMWRKKISVKSNLRVFYRASINTPSISQLQNVYNNNDPLYITTGNPDLKQQTGNTLSARYTFTNTGKGTSFFANVFLQQNNNYISNATYIAASDSVLTPTVTLYKGSQFSKPVNLDGYISLRSFVTYGMPVKFLKSNVNINAGFTWAKTPGMINYVKSLSNNYNYNAGVVVASNISEYVDFNVSYSANFNVIKNSVQPILNNNYISQNAGVQLNLLSKKGWFIQNDVSNQSYSGLSGGFDQSYWLWNAAVGKKIFKKQSGELKLSVFDLLKQNRSITRTATESYVEDVQNQVLQQYFMLTFTYKLKNFGTGKPVNNNRDHDRGMPMGGTPPF